MPAGELRERVTFYTQTESDTSYGLTTGDWDEQFTVAARIRPLTGSEPVIAQRLTGIQPFVITVRYSTQTKTIETSWRVDNARTGVQYQIRSISRGERKDYIDIVAEAGVAQ